MFLLLFLLPNLSYSQNCDLIELMLNKSTDSTYKYIQILEDFWPYYFLNDSFQSPFLKKKLRNYFSKTETTMIFDKINKSKKSKLTCCNSRFRFINSNMAENINENNKSVPLDDMLLLKEKYIYFVFAAPIFIKEFALIQITRMFKSNNSFTETYLYKYKDGEWQFVVTLQSSAS